MNNVFLTGNLGQDVESGGNASVANTSMAFYNGKGKDGKPKSAWLKLTFWNETAERAIANLSKGDRVNVTGRLGLDEWEDSDGNKKSKPNLTVFQFDKLEKFDASSGSAPKTAAKDDSEDFDLDDEDDYEF